MVLVEYFALLNVMYLAVVRSEDLEMAKNGLHEKVLKHLLTPRLPARYDSVAHLGVPHCRIWLRISSLQGYLPKFQNLNKKDYKLVII